MRTALSLMLGLAPTAALADACDTVKASLDKLAATPAVHQTMKLGDGTAMQMIAVGDAMYLDHGGGQWMKLPLQPGARAAMMAAALPDAAALKDCQEAGSEDVGGVATTVYAYVPPSMAGETPVPQKLWIGKADGLPYRMVTTSEGEPLEMTVSYAGVTAPIE